MYDKIYRSDMLYEAYKRVRANKGCAGLDEVSFEEIEKEVGLIPFLKGIQEELRTNHYQPQAVLRCWIEKAGKQEKRPLGIPTIKDRVIQMAAKLVLEPIFETNFRDCSYGFRPNCSTHGAMKRLRQAITFKEQRTIIDVDIKGYFDTISHDLLMQLLERRISDKRVLKLIWSWLKAGVMEEGEFVKAKEIGSPQGSVISPLLSNIYLHSFDVMFEGSGIKGTLIRYADDIRIALPSTSNGKRELEEVERMLKKLKLTLHPEKTRIVKAEEGVDFLGSHFRYCEKETREGKRKRTLVWPSKSSIKNLKAKVKETIGRRYDKSLKEMIEQLNPILKGWSNYHREIPPPRGRLLKLNGYVRERLRIFLKRKYSDETRGNRRASGRNLVKLGLFQFVL